MKYRKVITITDWRFWVVMALAALFALGIATVRILSMEHTEDLNGPGDPSLATITREELLSTSVNYIATMGGSGGEGARSGVEGDLRPYDHERFHLKYRELSGTMTLQATYVTEPVLTLDFDTILTAGNLEIVILIDGEYDRHVDVQGQQTVQIENAAGKTVVVRIAAESAQLELTVSRR